MIKKVKLRYFKRFKDESFELSDSIILAGSNNSGKSTLLQAIALWNLARQKWLARSKTKQGKAVAITRQELTTMPLREMNLLWTDRSTALLKKELSAGQKLGTPRLLVIEIEGINWSVAFEFYYQSAEQVYIKPSQNIDDNTYKAIQELQVVYVPPFSGIGAEETSYDIEYQNYLIGQGKPGDILRNLLLSVYQQNSDNWQDLSKYIVDIFGYKLLKPIYDGRPFIVCEYQVIGSNKQGKKPKLDISSAGSGFLQVLMLMGFFYARPASILLLDEPDAHLHIVLQKQIYELLQKISYQRACQLLIATHSEVIIDNTSPEKIISLFNKAHKLSNQAQRQQVQAALKHLTSLDLLFADVAQGILYLENETDLNLLREWASVLKHPAAEYLLGNSLFWHPNQGCDPRRKARPHFFALKAVKPQMRGLLILDADNRQLADRELSAEGLMIIRWKRYEIENYLLHPTVLTRFVNNSKLFANASAEQGLEYLQENLPPAVFKEPLKEHDYLITTPASKSILPNFFDAAKIPLTKNQYHQIAATMNIDEIPMEVIEKLDLIHQLFS